MMLGEDPSAKGGTEFDDRGGGPTKWDADEVPAAREARRLIPRALSDPEHSTGSYPTLYNNAEVFSRWISYRPHCHTCPLLGLVGHDRLLSGRFGHYSTSQISGRSHRRNRQP